MAMTDIKLYVHVIFFSLHLKNFVNFGSCRKRYVFCMRVFVFFIHPPSNELIEISNLYVL